jgi:hypothetical protein
MTSDEILAAIAAGVRDPRGHITSPTTYANALNNGINIIGQLISKACPEFFNIRKSISSYTNSFAFPSDLIKETRIRDLKTNAKSITGAANNGANLIRITCVAHGFSDGDLVYVHDVGGVTAANGLWKIDWISANTFDLLGSAWGASVYTSGGKVFKETTDFTEIVRKPHYNSNNNSPERWYLRGAYFVVDDITFDNDILVDYYCFPTTLADIPARFHYGLVAYGVITLIKLPAQDQPMFADYQMSQSINKGLWDTCVEHAKAFTPTSESNNVSETPRKVGKGGYI